MNQSDILHEELSARLGERLEVFSPSGQPFNLEGDHAFIVLKGTVDLFVAKRRGQGGHGHSVPLCPQLEAGALVPACPADENLVFYGRCLPDTELARVPWKLVQPSEEPMWRAVGVLSQSVGWSSVPRDVPSLLAAFDGVCKSASEDLEQVEIQTEELIRNNLKAQRSREKVVHGNLATLFNLEGQKHIVANPDDPLAAAAERVASMCGIPNFTMEMGNGLKERIERSVESQRVRITPAQLKKGWYKECFLPTLLIAKDGKDAFCAYRNNRGDYVAWSGATGQLFALDEDACEAVESCGWNFVKPLPEDVCTWKGLLRYICSIRPKKLVLVVMLLLGNVLLEMVTPAVNSKIFSDVIPNSNVALLGMLFSLMMVVAFSQTIFEVVTCMLSWNITENIELPMQLGVFDHLLRLPVAVFRNTPPGEMARKVLAIKTMFAQSPAAMIGAVVKLPFLVFPVAMLFYYSQELALAVLPILCVSMLTMIAGSIFISKYSYEEMKIQGETTGLLERFIAGISKLRSAGAESQAMLNWSKKLAEEKDAFKKKFQWNALLNIFQTLMPWLVFCTTTGVIVYYCWEKLGNGAIAVADFTGFVSTVSIINGMLLYMSAQAGLILQLFSIFKWLTPILATREEDGCGFATDATEISGAVELDHVSFSYDEERQILKDVSIKAEPGEFIAITGESGAGKSTLLRLLLRFEHPSSGTVLYDHEDVEDKNMNHIRSQIGVVLQNANLLADTILNNIVGLTSSYTEQDAWMAAEMAGCADDIRSFPMQMQTMLNDSLVSGGQKQRILLAQALIRNPKLIFLDEATSALDNRTQRHVIEALKKVKATKIVIAHRLSTILEADRIYVLDQGSVAEVGTYDELMEKKGLFASMASRQMVN